MKLIYELPEGWKVFEVYNDLEPFVRYTDGTYDVKVEMGLFGYSIQLRRRLFMKLVKFDRALDEATANTVALRFMHDVEFGVLE